MPRRGWAVLAAGALGLAVAAGVWLGRQSRSGPSSPAISGNARTSEASAAVDVDTADPAPRMGAPVPAPIASPEERAALALRPVREQIRALDARARDGDDDAACRLGVAIQRCVRHVRSPRPATAHEAAEFVARHPEIEQDGLVEMMARSEARWEAEASRCAGMTEADQLLGLRYLLVSAQRGNATARHAFVVSDLSLSDTLRDPELARFYAEHAPRLFERMMSEGDPRAIEVLHLAAHANSIDTRRAAWHAIPEPLRNPAIARALWQLRRERAVAFARPEMQGLQSPNETPIDPAVLAEAERLWQQTFDASVETAKLREHGARRWEGGRVPAGPHRAPDPCAVDSD